MDFVLIALTMLLAIVAIGAVVWPIFRPAQAHRVDSPDDQVLAELLVRRDTALRAVKDLEFDYQTGKVSNEDYAIYEQRLKEQAVASIQAVDDYQTSQREATAHALDAVLEAQIAALRRTAPISISAGHDNGHTDLSPTATDTTTAPVETGSTRYCPQCGRPVHTGDRFCAACGAAVASMTATAGIE